MRAEDDVEQPALDGQQAHWHSTLAARPEMFGRDPSVPAQASAAELQAAGARRVLELGGG